jgi:competence protein ComEA
MYLNREPIRNWFGYNRRERRSTFTLLLIVVLILVFRYVIPERSIGIEDVTDTIAPAVLLSGNSGNDSSSGPEKFSSEKIMSEKLSRSGFQTVISTSMPQKSKIDINRSDSATLVRLPGIGPVLSARIIKYRRLLGGFARIEQLNEVYGLSEETYEMIAKLVSADSSFIVRININTADYRELAHIRYFDKYELSSILKYRQLKGRINCINDLVDNKLITNEKAVQTGPYLRFD